MVRLGLGVISSVDFFQTQPSYDILTINGVGYSGADGPAVGLVPRDTVDGYVENYGGLRSFRSHSFEVFVADDGSCLSWP